MFFFQFVFSFLSLITFLKQENFFKNWVVIICWQTIFCSQDPFILDKKSDQAKVRGTIQKMMNTMEDLQNRAFQYKSYQKQFKVKFSGVFFSVITPS